MFSPPQPKRDPLELMQQIKEIKRGILKKKNRFFMKQTRIFVLTTEPRLKYYKTEHDFRGEIPLTQEVVAKTNGDGSFSLIAQRKTYVMVEIAPGDAEEWVEAINEAVQTYSINLNK